MYNRPAVLEAFEQHHTCPSAAVLFNEQQGFYNDAVTQIKITTPRWTNCHLLLRCIVEKAQQYRPPRTALMDSLCNPITREPQPE